MASLQLDRVTALLRAAGAVGLVAVRGDGGPTVDLFMKDGALCLGLKGRMNGGRRNLGDVDGGVIEISMAVPEGNAGPATALGHLHRAVEAMGTARKGTCRCGHPRSEHTAGIGVCSVGAYTTAECNCAGFRA